MPVPPALQLAAFRTLSTFSILYVAPSSQVKRTGRTSPSFPKRTRTSTYTFDGLVFISLLRSRTRSAAGSCILNAKDAFPLIMLEVFRCGRPAGWCPWVFLSDKPGGACHACMSMHLRATHNRGGAFSPARLKTGARSRAVSFAVLRRRHCACAVPPMKRRRRDAAECYSCFIP